MMPTGTQREVQRLLLTRALPALINGRNAVVLDIGAGRILLEHSAALPPGTAFRLLFVWEGDELEFDAVVQDTTRAFGDQNWHTWASLTRAIGTSQDRMEEQIARHVSHILAAQRANAIGSGAALMPSSTILLRLGDARRTRSRGWVRYQLSDRVWSRAFVDSAEQATDGFTVAAYEDVDELEILCRAYEQADEDGRRLIRLVAELSALSTQPAE